MCYKTKPNQLTARVLTAKRTQEAAAATKPEIRKKRGGLMGDLGQTKHLAANASIVNAYTWSETVKSQLEQFMDVAPRDISWDIADRKMNKGNLLHQQLPLQASNGAW